MTGPTAADDAGREALASALADVLALHARQDKPVRSWDLDLRCAAHDWTRSTVRGFGAVRDCPDCSYRDRYPCTHCRDEDWPCPTAQAVIRHVSRPVAELSEPEPPERISP